ncbi:guanylate cyclase alpha-like [Colias croceus]|uniref:guanylate cyclase alpha-like n=1 Tax=Colias crocea TaxID=72248 RepID=UPI001E27F128|nr:guanylate cyclase alpha-like [Colias croceus]
MHNENNLKGKVIHQDRFHINSYNGFIELPKIQRYHKKGRIKRKLIKEELDLTEYRKLFNDDRTHSRPQDGRHPYRVSNKNISNMLEALTTEIRGLKHLYGLDETSPSTFVDDVSETITQRPQDFSTLDGTAEIEAALNEIKQRSIQMMVEQLPSVAEIVTSTVTQTTYEVASTENYLKLGIRCKKACQHSNPRSEIRSIKCDAVTLANKIECMLQKKLKNAYGKVKEKIANDFKKEVNETRSTIQAEITKIRKGKTKCQPKKIKCKNCLPGALHLASKELINNRTTFVTKKITNTNLHMNSMPKTTDEYSMLSIYEQLLVKPHGHTAHTVLDKLVTPNVFIKERKLKDKLSKRNLVHTTDNHSFKNNIEKSYQDDDIPDIGDYNEADSSSSEATTTNKHDNTTSTGNDMSMEALSNKISYNDYVNGFKYYLKFQKDRENEKFSNLVRYQAHKHHNVDDVGKYILNKLPQIPSTRSKRFLFEQETVEDQEDISTKSDDSWFKKHFYLFIDKDPPRKFHTAQTVSLNSGFDKTILTNVRTEMSPTRSAVHKNKHNKIKKVEKKKTTVHTKHLEVRSVTEKLFEDKNSVGNAANSNKKGYVDITMIQKPTDINKTYKNKDHGKLRLFHKELRFNKQRKNKNSKRDVLYRKTRFNPFKNLKDIFKNPGSNTAITKIFDYDIISSSSDPFTSFNFGQNPNIEAMIRQIPNITGSSESPFDIDDNEHYVSQSIMGSKNYLHNDGFYNSRLRNDNKINRFSNLHENRMEDLERSLNQNKIDNSNYYKYIDHNKRLDDIINVRIKTEAPLVNPWKMTLPSLPTGNQENDDLDNLAVSITYIGDDPLKRFGIMTGNNSPNKVDYDNVEANFHKSITDINDMNNIYQKYYQNIPFRLNLPQTTTKDEIEDDNIQDYRNNNHPKEVNYFSNSNSAGNRLSTEKEIANSRKLYNVQLFKNGVRNDNSHKYKSFDRNKIISSAHFKPMKDSSLLPQSNLQIQDRMRYQYEVKQNNNVLNENINPIKTVAQGKPENNNKPVAKRLHMNDKNSYQAYLKTIKYSKPNVDNYNFYKIPETNYDNHKIHNKMKVLDRRYTAGLRPNILHGNLQSSKNLDSSSHNNHIISKHKAPSGIKKNPTQFNKTHTWNNIVNNNKKLPHNHRGIQKAALTQIIKVPQQYFITPLPMDADDFDRFLKEHEMDVESVTASLKDGFISNKSYTKADSVTKPFISYVRKNYHINKSKERHEKRKKRKYTRLRRDLTTTASKLVHEKSKRKRELVREHTFTAKDVAALEIVIDLSKNNQTYCNEKEITSTQTERMSNIVTNTVARDKQKLITNAIQVHISLPGNSDKRKRSAESVQVRKVFSAKFSSPVDLEYQVNSFENETSTTTTVPNDSCSPGIYLLIENSNLSDPSGKLILRPMQIKKSDIETRNIADDLNNSYSSTSAVATYKTGNLTKVAIKRTIRDRKTKRYIKWDPIKKFFGHERVCNCRCKANKTMCKPCAAGDVIISELVFELDNLAKFMQDHCTEIQTFFWMNPTGGKKLREVVNKIDKSLNHYYKRVKGKCQGRPCKMYSSGIDKRRSQRDKNSYDRISSVSLLVKDLNILANNLEKANILDKVNSNVQYYGQNLLHNIHNCMPQVLEKRSTSIDKNKQTKSFRSVYSLDNVNVNLICSPRQYTTYSTASIESSSTLYNFPFKNNPRINSYDYENYRYKMDGVTARNERARAGTQHD